MRPSTLVDRLILIRTRRSSKGIQGNNKYGRKGQLACAQCRKRKSKVCPLRQSTSNPKNSVFLMKAIPNRLANSVALATSPSHASSFGARKQRSSSLLRALSLNMILRSIQGMSTCCNISIQTNICIRTHISLSCCSSELLPSFTVSQSIISGFDIPFLHLSQWN